MKATIEGAKEVLGKRTRYAKHFQLPDGRMRCLASPVPLHYRRDNKWRSCDPTWREFRVDRCDHITTVSKDRIALTYTSRQGGGSVTCELALIGDKPVNDFPLKINPREEGNRVTWEDVLPGLDIYLVARPSGVEFFKVLKSDDAPTAFTWRYKTTGNPPVQFATKTSGHDAGKIAGSRTGTVSPRKIKIENQVAEAGSTTLVREEFMRKAIVIDKKTRKRSWGDSFEYPVTIDASISENITAGADDVQEHIQNATTSAVGTKIRMGYGPFTVSSPPPYYSPVSTIIKYAGGFRFQSLAIPTGSTIDSATLTLKRAAHNGANQSWVFKVNIDDADDAAAWGASDRPSTGMNKFGNVTLNLNTSMGSPGNTFTADLQSALQQVLNRAGWASGNDVRFGIEHSAGAGMTSSSWVEVWAYEKTTNIPVLDVTYTLPGTSRDLLWNVQTVAASTGSLLWNVATRVQKSTQLLWNVYVNIDAPKTADLLWNVTGVANKTAELLWDVEAIDQEQTQGMAWIFGQKRPVLNPKDAVKELQGKELKMRLGNLVARVDSIETVQLSAAKARPGKLYAVGVETPEKQKKIPAKPDDEVILFTLALIDSDEV